MAQSNITSETSTIEWRISNFSRLTGYPTENMKFFRKIGPRPQSKIAPARGSELFVHRLPPDAFEDEVFWFFHRAGNIYDIRLMMRPSGLANRGFAFVRYCNPEDAQTAITTLSKAEFRFRHKIFIDVSLENNRLFLSGIPLTKTKEETFDELSRVGIRNIVDIIMYRGFRKSHVNRGFVFIEFDSHESAASIKMDFKKTLRLWNRVVILDWAEPLREVDASVMAKVTRLFIRNLDVKLKQEALHKTLQQVLKFQTIEKVHKHMGYCFVHFYTRQMAEEGLKKLQEYYGNTDVEVTWSKPPGLAKHRFVPPRMQNEQSNTHSKPTWSWTKNSRRNIQSRRNAQFQHRYEKEGVSFNRTNEDFQSRRNERDWDPSCGLKDYRCEGGMRWSLVDKDSYGGRCSRLNQDTGECSSKETVNQTFNFSFQLDIWEKPSNKYNAT